MRRLIARVEPAAQLAATSLGLSNGIELQPMPGAVPVVRLNFPDERLPIYLTDAGSQMLCICYLFQEHDVKKSKRMALLETLLDLNISIPLSDFGRIGTHYVLFGSLSPQASADDLALEISTLSNNANDALATLADFLRTR